MTGGWLASYVVLWAIVGVLGAFLAGALREITILRSTLSGWEATPEFTIPDRINDGPPLGSSLPTLTLQSANGHGSVSLYSLLDDGALLVVFLGSLCPSCHDIVDAINSAVGDQRDLKVIVILEGSEPASRGFIEVFRIDGPVVLDPLGQISSQFNSHHVPYGYLYSTGATLTNKGTIASESEVALLLADGDSTETAQPGGEKEANLSNSRDSAAQASH